MRRLTVTPLLLLLGLATALAFVSADGTRASAEGVKKEMTISPTDKHYSVQPGETINDSFVILNSGQAPYDFSVYSAPYSVKDPSYSPDTSTTGGRADAFQWIQFKQATWHASVRDTVTVPFTIHVSKYASPGGHYAVIFADENSKDQASTTGVARNLRMGMIVYVNVKGDASSQGSVDHFDLNWYQSAAPITAGVRVNNTGETDFPVSASFVVSDLFGRVKYNQKLSDIYVIPNAPRDLNFSWDNAPWLGIYKAQIGVEVLGKSTVRQSYVVVAPRWLLFVAGLVLLLGVIRAVQARSNRSHATSR